ncbi:MAG: hypothetical protein V3V33_16710, partial [Candidatus Lokiarchaeia archaeon]
IILFFILLFTIFDFLLGNLLCSLLYLKILFFFIPGIEIDHLLRPIFLYCFLYGFLFLYLIIKFKSSKLNPNLQKDKNRFKTRETDDLQNLNPKAYSRNCLLTKTGNSNKKTKAYKKLKNINFNPKRIFLIFISFFTGLLLIEIITIISREFNLSYEDITTKNYFLLYLDIIFLNIGFIGILAIYLSYFSYKKDKKLFYFLVLWIIFSISFASVLIFKNYILFLSNQNIPTYEIDRANYWFNRSWYDSIPGFSILASFGLIELGRKAKNYLRINLNRKIKLFHVTKNVFVSIIIFMSLSNLIITGMHRGNTSRKLYYDQAQVIGWISDNIPPSSNILLQNHYYPLRSAITRISKLDVYYVSDFSNFEGHRKILEFMRNESIHYALLHDDEVNYLKNHYPFSIIPDVYNIILYSYNNLTVYSTNLNFFSINILT